jgi:ribosomal protein S18 acetylase RimI-like enzyme
MVRLLYPLDNKRDFDTLTDFLFRNLNDDRVLKYVSYSLKKFTKEEIVSQTEKHRENSMDYLVYEQDNEFKGVLTYKKKHSLGFELFLLIIENAYRQKGIGQSLINECIAIATKENYPSIDSMVFEDNKPMLNLLQKNGFRQVGVQNSSRTDGTSIVWMIKVFE